MRNFIGKIIERLRGFIYGDTGEATGETVVGDTIAAIDARAPATVGLRIDEATLTPAGILFKGLRYVSPALGEMLSRSGPGKRAKVTIKRDPSDASSIHVQTSTARPQAQWITVPVASAAMNLSFADHTRLRDFAKTQQMPFSTEADRSEARKSDAGDPHHVRRVRHLAARPLGRGKSAAAAATRRRIEDRGDRREGRSSARCVALCTAGRNRWTSHSPADSESLSRANRPERAWGRKDSSRQERIRC